MYDELPGPSAQVTPFHIRTDPATPLAFVPCIINPELKVPAPPLLYLISGTGVAAQAAPSYSSASSLYTGEPEPPPPALIQAC